MKTEQTEFQKALEIYKDLSLNEMLYLLNLMSKHITIPHYENGVTDTLEVEGVYMNGASLQINTDSFNNHCNQIKN